MTHQTVLILDYGSQYTQLIARRVRELNVFCVIEPYTMASQGIEAIEKMRPAAIIMSGGPSSVYDENAPGVHPGLFGLGIPVLGICYGLQLMAHVLGGKVEKSDAREYGIATLEIVNPYDVLSKFQKGESAPVWMSHGDKLALLPEGFSILGLSENTPYCAVANASRRLYGLQFHPEVAHTPRGSDIIASFLFDISHITPSWTSAAFIDEAVSHIQYQVGDGVAVCGLSGGVDSSVAATLCHRALGDKLTCIFVDNGLLRLGEYEFVLNMFRNSGLNVVGVNAKEKFLTELAGITDPEAKRKVIGRVFIDVFQEAASKINADFLVQGTVYPDVIESGSVLGPSAVIKSHHNVGGLPETMKLSLVEPLRMLFKDEVRAVGASLGMAEEVVWRQPFPGPGLAIRCLGEVTEERLDVLRRADAIVDAEIRAAGLYGKLWQSFCVLLPVRSVGVMGDCRTYDETCAIRAVTSTDGMTADWARLPYDLLARMSTRIINEVNGINRVVYDVTSKPAGTIEWE